MVLINVVLRRLSQWMVSLEFTRFGRPLIYTYKSASCVVRMQTKGATSRVLHFEIAVMVRSKKIFKLYGPL